MALEPRDLVVVGASAGGVEALRGFAAGLPRDLPAAVAVVLHLPSGGTSALPAILSRSGPLPAVTATDGMTLAPGRLHVAPPDHHLMVTDGTLTLSRGPTENGHRPAVDVLFRSAAIARGPRVIGVVLSGALDDGTAGMVSIAARGGVVVIQDPEEALYPSMPSSVLRHVRADHVLAVADIGAALRARVRQLVDADLAPPPSTLLSMETLVARQPRDASPLEMNDMGTTSRYTCPDCHGTLVELTADLQRYRCHVGHAWTAEALLQAQANSLGHALWTALRTLDEKVSLARKLRAEATARGNDLLAKRYERTEEESNHAAEVLRSHLLSGAISEQAQADHPS